MHPILPPSLTQTPSFYPQGIQKRIPSIPVKSGVCSPDFLSWTCTFDTFLSSIYPYCLLHLGAISPSCFSQITGVIEEKWFVLVPFLHSSGKRARKTAPAVFPVLRFLWLWGWGFSTLVYLYMLCDVKNMLWTDLYTILLLLQMKKSLWETASVELSVEEDR